MLGTLIKKDFARLRMNWRGLAVLLAMPMCITALIGTVFGPSAKSGDFPRIKLAIVNEDDNIIGGFISGAAADEQSNQYLDSTVTTRDEAMKLINADKLSAVLVIPEQFSEKFFQGEEAPSLQLIKNPAQAYMPAITEELTRVIVELLDAVSKNLMSELPELQQIAQADGAPDVKKLIRIATHIGSRLERAEPYIFPPIVGIAKTKVESSSDDEDKTKNAGGGVFAFILPGLVAVFLLFVAEGSVRDVLVEQRNKTLHRFLTLRSHLMPFLLAKSAYSMVVVLVSAAIMLLGGSFIFGISWQHPMAIACLTISYAVFSVGFANLLIAVAYREQVAAAVGSIVIMMIGFLGGSMMPTQTLPGALRDYISPWMPNYIYAEAVKSLQFGSHGPRWPNACLMLVLAGFLFLTVATTLMNRRLKAGLS